MKSDTKSATESRSDALPAAVLSTTDAPTTAGKVWITAGPLEIRVSRHDADRVELRMVSAAATRNQPRRVECWWFVPSQVAGNHQQALATWLHDGMRTMRRFEAPEWDLAELASGANPESPIEILYALVNSLALPIALPIAPPAPSAHNHLLAITRCARLATATTIDSIRDANRLLKQTSDEAKYLQADQLATLSATAMDRIHQALGAVTLADGADDSQLRLIIDYLDHEWQIISGKLQHQCPPAIYARFAQRLADLDRQFKPTRTIDLRTLNVQAAEEARLRQSVAKKIIFSDLHITEEEAVSSRLAGDIVGSIAAAIAMTFAVMVSYVTSTWWGISSIPFLIVAILAYIFKDRIKESLRQRGTAWIRYVIPDRVIHLRAVADGRDLGTVREHLEAVAADRVPAAIAACRRQGDRYGISMLAHGERIVRHMREWRSNSSTTSTERVASILRVDLSKIIHQLDDPAAKLRLANTETRTVSRIYEVFLVIQCSSDQNTSVLTGIRIVLDGAGIRRVEAANPVTSISGH